MSRSTRTLLVLTIVCPLLVTLFFKARVLCDASPKAVAYFQLADPVVFMLTNRDMIILACMAELLVIGTMIVSDCQVLKWKMVVWLGSLFLAYRGFSALAGKGFGCNCLGVPNMMSAVFRSATSLLFAFAIYMVVLGLFMIWRTRRSERMASLEATSVT